jgi:hypothetical protein
MMNVELKQLRTQNSKLKTPVAIPKTKATLLLFLPCKVRVASGVINCPLALRTGDAVLRVSRLRLLVATSGDALILDIFCTEKQPYWRTRLFASSFSTNLHACGFCHSTHQGLTESPDGGCQPP